MKPKYLAVLLSLLIAGGLIWGLKLIFPLIAPFLIGIIFACLIEPFVKNLERSFNLNRSVAIIVTLIILVIAILAFLILTISLIYFEVQRCLPQAQLITDSFSGVIERVTIWFQQFLPGIKNGLLKLNTFNNSVDHLLKTLLVNLVSFVSQLPQILISILIGAITAFFYSRDQQLIKEQFLRIIPCSLHQIIARINEEIIENVAKFVRVEITLVLLTSCFTWITFRLLGIDSAATYGFLAGVFDIIPIMGPGMIFIPAAIVSFLIQKYSVAFVIIGSYFVLIFIRQVVQLRIVGDCFNFHPLLTLLVFYIGLKLFGIIGIILGPIMLIVLRGYYRIAKQFCDNGQISET